MLSRVYVLINVMDRWVNDILARLQLAHLRAKGARIGRNVLLRPGARISIGRSAQLIIGDDVTIDRLTDIIVGDGASLTIGNRVYIGKRNTVSARQEVYLGDCCFTAHDVTVLDTEHRFSASDHPIRDQGASSRPVRLDGDTWLGAGVTVLAGVHLGSRTVVGAGSVVTSSFPGDVVLGGIPARPIKSLSG